MSAAMDSHPRLAVSPAVEQALALVAADYFVAPVTVRRNPLTGKKMPTYHGLWGTISTRDPEQVRAWAAEHGRGLGFAIDCEASGIAVIDLDLKPDEGVDAVTWWHEQGLPVSPMVVQTPGDGLHQYFRQAPDPVRNSEGKIAKGVDVRGAGGHTFAPGTAIVGEGGHSWQVATQMLPVHELPVLPDEVIARIPVGSRRRERSTGPRAEGAEHNPRWIEGELRRQRRLVGEHDAAPGSGFRAVLRGASLMHGRALAAGLIERERAVKLLRKAVVLAWGSADAEDELWIDTGIDDGEADPWTIVPDPGAEPDESDDEDDVRPSDQYEKAVLSRLRDLKINDEARRRLQREQRAERPAIADGLIDDLDTIETPKMLLGSLIPEHGVGFIAGRSGSYKSFLAVSWACCIATGTSWLGRDEFAVTRPLRTLYVAAEGSPGAAARMRAWEAYTGVSRRGKVTLYPRPIYLNDPDQLDELIEVITAREFAFVVIDTYHRSAPNTEENSSTEFGVVFEAAARIRDASGVGVLFVDHTGHAGERLRGTSAKGDDADYVLLSTYAGEERGPTVPRELSVAKLKDEESSGRWPIGLTNVPGHFPIVTIREDGDEMPDVFDPEWWQNAPRMSDQDHETLSESSERNRGVACAASIWSLLTAIDTGHGNEQGLTVPAIMRMINAVPGVTNKWSEASIRVAVGLLTKTKFVTREKDRIYLVTDLRYEV